MIFRSHISNQSNNSIIHVVPESKSVPESNSRECTGWVLLSHYSYCDKDINSG